jgi:hypothetical protein
VSNLGKVRVKDPDGRVHYVDAEPLPFTPPIVLGGAQRWSSWEARAVICDAKIRPFTDSTELRCDGDHYPEDGDPEHASTLRDYAFPGSATTIHWRESDRRNFRGEYPGRCDVATPTWPDGLPGETRPCVLPVGHRGGHAP